MQQNILVIDNSKLFRAIARSELEEGGFLVLEAEDGERALKQLKENDVHLITMGIELAGHNGYELCQKIVSANIKDMQLGKRTRKLPIIIISSHDSLEERNLGFKAGAADYMVKPYEKGELLNRAKRMLSPENPMAGLSALVVDDSLFIRKIIADALHEKGVTVYEASDGQIALNFLRKFPERVDIIISDFVMPNLMGHELCFKIRNELELKDIPIIIVTSFTESISSLDIFKAGATDYIKKPFIKEELFVRLGSHLENIDLQKKLQRKLKELEEANTNLQDFNKKLSRAARMDHLTKLPNRRPFHNLFPKYLKQAQNGGPKLYLMLMDIDHFKKVNDNYGHDVGDMALVRMSKILKIFYDQCKLIARIGGEEFAILGFENEKDKIKSLAESIRKTLASSAIDTGQNDPENDNKTVMMQITASFGVALCKPGDSMDTMYKRADQLLYHAKETGRNCVYMEEMAEAAE